MANFLETVDGVILNKVFTPLSHYLQRRFGVLSYELSRICFELASLTYLIKEPLKIYGFGHTFDWMAFVNLILAAWMFSNALYLRYYLTRSESWKWEPVYITHQLGLPFTALLLLLITAMTSLFALFAVNQVLKISLGMIDPEVIEAFPERGSITLYALDFFLLSYPSAFYFARVRPLPPSQIQREVEKREQQIVSSGAQAFQ